VLRDDTHPEALLHDDLRDRLGRYVLGAVDGQERVAIEHHLADCRDCRRAAITQLASAAHLVGEPLRLAPTLWDSMVDRAAARHHS
jgi:anti-sigma factor RsiW